MCSSHGIKTPRRFGVELEGYVKEDLQGSIVMDSGESWDVTDDGSLESCDETITCNAPGCENGRVGCDECSDGRIECSDCSGRQIHNCGECGGSGEQDYGDGHCADCENCSGSGEVSCDNCNYGYHLCDECDGRGTHTCEKCDGDGTISNPDMFYPVEVRSEPISDTGSLYEVYEALREKGWFVNDRAGLHVHVEVVDYELREFQKLALLGLAIEPFIFGVTGERRYNPSGYGYSRGYNTPEYRERILRFIQQRGITLHNEVQHFHTQRYMGLNFQAYNRGRPTIEFRYFSPQDNPEKVEAYVELVTKMVEFAKHAKREHIAVIVEKLESVQGFEEMKEVVAEVLELQFADRLHEENPRVIANYPRVKLSDITEYDTQEEAI